MSNGPNFGKQVSTDNGIEITDCLVNLEAAAIELVVGRHAQEPGEFSPLVERNADPVYSSLDACDVIPTWPTETPNK